MSFVSRSLHAPLKSSLPTVSRPSPSASSRLSRATSKINFDILSQDLQNSNLICDPGNVGQQWDHWHAKVMSVLDKHASLKPHVHRPSRRHKGVLCTAKNFFGGTQHPLSPPTVPMEYPDYLRDSCGFQRATG